MTFQDVIFTLEKFWAKQGCVIHYPYDVEVGAGTMHPETFFRVLGKVPWRVAYLHPSRRPADGRYGENPNRLYKHFQYQVILKPAPRDIQDIYLASLIALGIDPKEHDLRFDEDNWEAPTLGAWGVGWQVLCDNMEITQFTYFQQAGGYELMPISVELTYGLERITALINEIDNIFELPWNDYYVYKDLRMNEEKQQSEYSFELATIDNYYKILNMYEHECKISMERKLWLAAYDFCLKCSHIFNILDARGAISITERTNLIAKIRNLTSQIAALYLEGQD
ncbi:MAG: glycine--tRNA ligase subunit alpha [Candidatus Fischerbacteria bacterium RBG_13_37_8]|uniref:Glycine--tRNA ligase alpha subunit n=1 Tax=Candidatus Fischerbacteria bacterium RBG_13_37_8 TaxID=1817863 RepID=A0A1F5VEK2_9BACT|nr:MAG: glycine--tRNA ligase subunit alpha [Candidatus Fischerbacteria bacterium RBG_13_37_8]